MFSFLKQNYFSKTKNVKGTLFKNTNKSLGPNKKCTLQNLENALQLVSLDI